MNKVIIALLIFGAAIAYAQPKQSQSQCQFNIEHVTNLAQWADRVSKGEGNICHLKVKIFH